MTKFNTPNRRKYIKGENRTVSIRIPESLKIELEKLAEFYGRGFSEFIQDGLDQYACFVREKIESDRK